MFFLKRWFWSLMGNKKQPNNDYHDWALMSRRDVNIVTKEMLKYTYDPDNMPQFTVEDIIEKKKRAQRILDTSPEDLEHPYWFTTPPAECDCRFYPHEAQVILRHVRECGGFGMEQSCRRAVKELCALKMSDEDRFFLLGSINFNCKLYKELRRRQRSQLSRRNGTLYHGTFYLGHNYHLQSQRWFEVTKEGQSIVVDVLFQIISANPVAFLHLVKPDI